VVLPDGRTITSSHITELNIPSLPPAARTAHIFPGLSNGSLISIGQLCDHGCTATFTSDSVRIELNNTVVLRGGRSPYTRLWTLDSPVTPNPPATELHAPLHDKNFANHLGDHSGTLADRIAFVHASLFSPQLSTWCKAIDEGRLTTFPDITSAQVKRHPPQSVPMVKGHLDQQRSNLRSTKPKVTLSASVDPDDINFDTNPVVQDPPAARTQFLYADFAEVTGKIFTDPTGRFVTTSSSGNAYMLVVYDYDSNFIHVEAMKNRTGPEILSAYKRAHAMLSSKGLRPQLQRLDNEASTALQQFMSSVDIDFQLAPPHVHRRNAAERAIRTFKNHFIAGLCSTDKNFPLHLWDRLLPQAIMTLNLLRGSRINPNLSSWAQLHGSFDYNRTPLAPPGIRVLVHEKPTIRRTWAPHAADGWYVGPAMNHYRCYRVWIKETTSERISDTLTWFPSQVKMPSTSSRDTIVAAAHDLAHALAHPSPASPLSPLLVHEREALSQLSDIFSKAANPVDSSLPVAPTATLSPPTASTSSPRQVRFRDPVTESLPRVPTATAAPPQSLPRVPPPNSEAETYKLVTCNPRQARRRAARKLKEKISASTSVVPTQATPAPVVPSPKVPTPPHSHGTRLQAARYPGHSFDSANAVVDPNSGATLEYSKLKNSEQGPEWIQAAANEMGRLSQGVKPNMPTGTDTMHFIPHTAKPHDRKATYLKIVAAIKPHKAEKYRIRFTVGGDRIEYNGPTSTPTAALPAIKILTNSVISTEGARFMTCDLKDFYLGTPLPVYEYMRIPAVHIPDCIMEQYKLTPLVHNCNVLVQNRKGMYGLPHAGRIANNRLIDHLALNGYHQAKHTPGFFTHKTRPISFSLVVDNFGVKYVGKEHAEHLLHCLEKLYTVTTDWTGALYCGLTFTWNYKQHHIDMAMPGYVEKALQCFQHPSPARPQHSPHAWVPPSYGVKIQLTNKTDLSPPLDKSGITRLQEVIGTLLHYARAVDSTMLVALGTLASAQTKGTEATAEAITQLLNYSTTHPDATVRYHASDMHLHIHSDASYLSESKAQSRADGIFFLGSVPIKNPQPNSKPPPLNGTIHTHCSIMKSILSSATEAELGALFFNAKDSVELHTTLEAMGHPQFATPIQTDNECASGIVNNTVKQQRSKAIDMRFYWIKDHVKQGQFNVHWRKGTDNLADYFTKHHSPSHHQIMQSRYLLNLNQTATNSSLKQGCVDNSIGPTKSFPIRYDKTDILPIRCDKIDCTKEPIMVTYRALTSYKCSSLPVYISNKSLPYETVIGNSAASYKLNHNSQTSHNRVHHWVQGEWPPRRTTVLLSSMLTVSDVNVAVQPWSQSWPMEMRDPFKRPGKIWAVRAAGGSEGMLSSVM
jgi:hypothetical protein